MSLRPTDLRKKQDYELVMLVMRENGHIGYSDSFNPYEVGTLRHDRFKRYYVRERKRFLDLEASWKSMCEVYGMSSSPDG